MNRRLGPIPAKLPIRHSVHINRGLWLISERKKMRFGRIISVQYNGNLVPVPCQRTEKDVALKYIVFVQKCKLICTSE